AIRLGKDGFDVKALQVNIDQLSEVYQLQAIDEQLYATLKVQEWSEDFCSQFSTYEIFKEQGMGFVILHQGEPVSGASSYTVFDKGIEIEIDTQAAYRRRGLALVCASKIILECLARCIEPHWDAANKASVALAEKLGYCLEKEYVTYEVNTQR
ncbi:MAG: GNAT family N-acetyltransferase, partial [Niameybacter sp.]